MPKAAQAGAPEKTSSSSVALESAAQRASHHPSLMLVDTEPHGDGVQRIAFSVPSGGATCVFTLEGNGRLKSPPKIFIDDIETTCQTHIASDRWVAIGCISERSLWWTPLSCLIQVEHGAGPPSQVRACLHRPEKRRSMVDATFLPAQRAAAWLPRRSSKSEAGFGERVDQLLASGEVEQAVKLTVAALALGLEDFKYTHGAAVLKAAAAEADFTVSNDGLKLFIAMSS
jgi:hypothetical protein